MVDIILTCIRCTHRWVPQVPHPKRCPLCHSPYWDKIGTPQNPRGYSRSDKLLEALAKEILS